MTAQTKQRIMLALSLVLVLMFCAYGALASWLVIGDSVNIHDYYGEVRIAAVTVRVFSILAVACASVICVAEIIKNKDTSFRFVAYGMGVGSGLAFACFCDLINMALNKVAWLFVVVPVVMIVAFELTRYFVLRYDTEIERPKNTPRTYCAAGACIIAVVALTAVALYMFLRNNDGRMIFSALYVAVCAVWVIYAIVIRKNVLSSVGFVVGFAFFAVQVLGFAYLTEYCLSAYGFVGTDILLIGFCTPLLCACVALAVFSIKKLFAQA
ncbi:MAG: hypothetical protein K2J01_04570 [Clostridiales bacterium]|nr:hypothetical protein [Clostridiales bacterium]